MFPPAAGLLAPLLHRNCRHGCHSARVILLQSSILYRGKLWPREVREVRDLPK